MLWRQLIRAINDLLGCLTNWFVDLYYCFTFDLLLLKDPLRNEFFLDPVEETAIRRYYEDEIITFCSKFNPPLPSAVIVSVLLSWNNNQLHMLSAVCLVIELNLYLLTYVIIKMIFVLFGKISRLLIVYMDCHIKLYSTME